MYVVDHQVGSGCAQTIGNHRVLVIAGVHVCAPIALPEEEERSGKGAYIGCANVSIPRDSRYVVRT